MKLKYKIPFFISGNKTFKSLLGFVLLPLLNHKRNNRIVLLKLNGEKVYNPRIKHLKVDFSGKNNYIEIKEPFSTRAMKVKTSGSNNKLLIGSSCDITGLRIALGENSEVIIADRFSSQNTYISLFNTNNCSVNIGSDCMFSYGVLIRVSDNHTIYDMQTKELLNPHQNIKIGNHVWLTARSMLLKGAEIPNNSIVGAGAIVSKKFDEPNSIIAGIPAKIIKRGINWNYCFPQDWELKKKYLE